MNINNTAVKDHNNNHVPVTDTEKETPGAISDLYNFLLDRLGGPDDAIVKIYKYDGSCRTYIYSFVNQIPDEDIVAKKFGGGQYRAYGYKGTNKSSVTKDFWIHHSWDKKAETPVMAQAPTVQPPPQSTLSESLDVLAKLVSIIKPLQDSSNTQQNDPTKVFNGMTDMYTKMMGTLVNESTKSQLESMRNFREQQKEILESKPEEKEDNSFFKEIVELIKSFGGQVDNPILKSMIKKTDKYQDIAQDQGKLLTLYQMLCGDPEYGEEKAKELLAKMGLEIQNG